MIKFGFRNHKDSLIIQFDELFNIDQNILLKIVETC